MSTGDQGVALLTLAERLGDRERGRIADEQIEVALATLRDGGHAPSADYYEAQFSRARALRDRLAGDPPERTVGREPERSELLAELERIRAMTPSCGPGAGYPTAEELIRRDRDQR